MWGKPIDIEHWSRVAPEWTAWARAPNHDAFWAYRAALVAFIGGGEGDAPRPDAGQFTSLLRIPARRPIKAVYIRSLLTLAELGLGVERYYTAIIAAHQPRDRACLTNGVPGVPWASWT